MKEYFLDISKIYNRLIKESPDNITIDGKYYNYDTTPNAYTGFINRVGGYVISEQIIGHYNLSHEISRLDMNDEDEIKSLFSLVKTSAKSLSDLRSLISERIKIRIWVNQKVFSMWDRYSPDFEESIKNALSSIGQDYKEYKYDNSYLDYEQMPNYEEFFLSYLTPEEKMKMEMEKLKQRQAERELADRLAGIKPKRSIDMDVPYKTKTPSWMNRGGD